MTPTDIASFQPKAWSILSRAVTSSRVASTYLLWGREGLGHWPLAISFAALLNCLERTKDSVGNAAPCGGCLNCRQIFALSFPGLHLVAPIATHKNLGEAIDMINAFLEEKRAEPFRIVSSHSPVTIPVDFARDIKSRLSMKGDKDVRRVVVFYQMDKMLHASADALLKMIEEPPLDTTIILTAENPDALLQTIQSRSQRIRLERVTDTVTARYLSERYQLDGVKALQTARLADGNPGQALSMTDSEGEEEEGSSQRAVGFLLFKSLFLDSNPTLVSHVTDLLATNDRSQVEGILRLWQSLIRDCVHYAGTGETEQIVNSDVKADLIAFSRHFDDPQLASTMADAIKNTLADIRLNVHISSAVVALALKLGMAIRTSR